MRSIGWLLASLLLLLSVGRAHAQFLYPGFGYSGVGFGGVYRGHHLTIGGGFFSGGYGLGGYGLGGFGLAPFGGYYPIAPYGISQTRVTINNYYPPTVVIAPARDDDLTGVDLDLVPPANRGGPAGPPRLPGARPLPERRQAVPPPNAGNRLPPPDEKPRPAVPAVKPPPPAERPPRAWPEPPPPDKDPKVESNRQIEAGVKAFTGQEFGVAAQRFRQAFRVDPNNSRAAFLLAQAQLALGKYREAFRTIQQGMDLEPDWPRTAFRPRLDLYKGHEDDFATQLKRLDEALAKKPGDYMLLFLKAHQLWFDGQRAAALAAFARARAVTLDTTYIDRFLRAAGPGAVADAR